MYHTALYSIVLYWTVLSCRGRVLTCEKVGVGGVLAKPGPAIAASHLLGHLSDGGEGGAAVVSAEGELVSEAHQVALPRGVRSEHIVNLHTCNRR